MFLIVKSRVKGNDFGGEHRVECGSTGHGSTIPRSRSARGLDREPDGDSEHRVEYEYASTIPRSRDLHLGIVEARSLDWEHVALGDSEHRVEYAEDFQGEYNYIDKTTRSIIMARSRIVIEGRSVLLRGFYIV